ncbi:hypothetical protein [Fulvimonas yonginensis]|uniref:Uncharacterized protein n=1 Tax=Fulvimonas yonginensis TaxID=1495200 RepID=A0ABU8J9W5_9GAMM
MPAALDREAPVTREDALAAIRASLARGSATPTLGTDDRESYLRMQAERLLEALIEPVPVKVVAQTFDHGLLWLLERQPAFAVAREGRQWLGFLPRAGEFFLACGRAEDALIALGFHSDDVLAEWLG